MGWKRLARHVVASDGDQVSQFSFDACDYLKVVVWINKQGTGDYTLYPNAVTSGSNFTARYGKDFGNYTQNNNHNGIHGNYGQLEGDCHAVYYISNIDGEEKHVQWTYALGASGNNAPDSFEAVGKYTTKTGQITSLSGTIGSGGFGAGSTITVYGKADNVVTDEKQTLADATRTELATATTTLDLSSASQTGTADTKFSVNTSSQQIDWEAKHDGSFDSIWWDLGASAVSDTAWVLHWTLNIDNKPEGNKWLITSLSSSVDSNGRNHRNSNSDSLCLTLTRHNDNGYSYFHIHDTDGSSFGGSSNPDSGDGTATYDFPLDTDLFCELRRTSATQYIGTIRTGSHTGTVIGTITGSCASTVTGLRYLQFSNWDTTSVYDNGTFDGYIKDVKLYNNATEYSATVSTAPNDGTQYRETDTRKIYRAKYSAGFPDGTSGSGNDWTEVAFDSSTSANNGTASGNVVTRSSYPSSGNWESYIRSSTHYLDPSEGGGEVYFTVSNNTHVSMGLEKSPYNSHPSGVYQSRDYSFHTTTATNNMYESTSSYDGTDWNNATNEWRITMDSAGLVKYYYRANSSSSWNLERTSTVTASGKYYVSVSVYSTASCTCYIKSDAKTTWVERGSA